MSDTFLSFIPLDPYWQPSSASADKAVSLLSAMIANPEKVEASFKDRVTFFDPGENLSSIACSGCGADAGQWWQGAMGAAYATDFKDLAVTAPCCGARVSLNDLRYVWAAGFGRFVLQARNPGIADTTEEQDRQLAECLGGPLRKIWGRQ